MLEPGVWVLVADGDTARLYSGGYDMKRLTPALPQQLVALNSDIDADFSARTMPSDEIETWNEPVEMWDVPDVMSFQDRRGLFADYLAGVLRNGASEGAYDLLIIAAVPQLMRRLECALSTETRERLVGRVIDDLTHLGPAGLGAYLRQQVFH